MTTLLKSLRAFAVAIFLPLCLSAQVQLGGHVYVPSSTDSTLGQAAVAFTSDANCTLTPATNCTVSGGLGGPYTGTLLVTGTISTTRNIIVPLSPGRAYVVENKTTGGQAVQIVGATGTGVLVPNGQAASVISDGTNYLTALGGVLSGPLYGQDVCWHYQPGNTPLTACLRYAGHGNYFGPYNTNDGVTFTPTPFSVGQLQVSEGGNASAGVQFWNGDTALGGSSALVAINGYATAPTGTCPNIGGSISAPQWALGADGSLSYCTNQTSSTWAQFSSGAGPASGDLSGSYPSPRVVGIQGVPVSSLAPANSQSLLWQQTTKSYVPHNPIVLPTSNVWFFTDSVGQGAGSTNYTADGWNFSTGANANNGWGYLVASAIGAGVVTNKGASGSLAADVIDSQVCSGNSTNRSVFSPMYASSLSYLEEGINDARQTGSTVPARETTYLQAEWAAIVTLGLPTAFLTTAFSSNVVYSGSVTPSYYFQNCPGQTMSSASETATVGLTTTGNPIFVQGVTYNSDTGLYTVTIDGNPAIDSITQTTGTFSNAPFAGTLLASAPWTRLVTMQRFAQYSVSGVPTNIPAGSHTMVITVTAPGTNGITFNWASSPQPQSFDYGAPTEQVWGVPYQQSNAQSAATAAYDALNMAACAQAQADGINAFCYDPRTTAQTLTGPNSITFGMSGTDGNTGQGVTLSDVSCTSGSSQCTSASYYFSNADVGTQGVTGKRIYIEGAGTAGAALYATIGSLGNFSGPNNSSHIVNLVNSLTGAAMTVGTTVSAATAYVGALCQVYPASSAPGLHANDCGHLQYARGSLGNMQPSTIAPNFSNLLSGAPVFTGNPSFNNYVQTTGLLKGITILNPAFNKPTPTENIIELNAATGINDLVLLGFEGVSAISFIGSGTGMTTGTYNIAASSGVAQIQCVVNSATTVGCVITNSGSGYGTAPTFNLSVLGGTPPGLTVSLGSPLNGQTYSIKRIDSVSAYTVSVISGGKYNGTANQTLNLSVGQSLDVWYDLTSQSWWSKTNAPGALSNGTTYTNLTPASTPFFGVISAGDSRFAGQNSNILPSQTFISQLNTQPQFSGRTTFAVNGAVAGSTCATMTTNYGADVFPYRPSAQGGVQVFQYIMEGINDIRTSVSFSSWSSCYYTYLQTITADGFTPVIATIYLDDSFGPGGNGAGDLLRVQWNNFIRSLQGQVINGQTIRVFDADAAVGVSTNLLYGTSVYNSPQANYAITGYSVTGGVGTFTTSAANPPAASTTSTFGSGAASITVASATGIVLGQYVTAAGVPAGDYVASIAGTTIGLAPFGTTAAGSAVSTVFNSPVLLSGFPSTSACLNASQTATVTYLSSTQFTMPVSCPNVASSTDTGLAQAMYFDGLHLNPQAVATVLVPAANRDFGLYNSGTPVTATPPDRTDFINPVSGTLYVNGNISATGTVSPANLTASAPLQSTTSASNGSFIKSTGGTAKLDISGSSTTAFVEFPTGSFWQMGNCFSADFTVCNGTSNLKPFDISTTAPTQSLWVLGSGISQSLFGFQAASAVATSSANQNSAPLESTGSYWTTSAQPDTWSWVDVLGTGTTPTSTYTLTHTGSSGTASVSIPGVPTLAGANTFTGSNTFTGGMSSTAGGHLDSGTSGFVDVGSGGVSIGGSAGTAVTASGSATSGANFNSYPFLYDGSYWNGSAAAVDSWTVTDALGTGANPSSTLTFTHSGSPTVPAVSVPSLNVGSTFSVSNTGQVLTNAVQTTNEVISPKYLTGSNCNSSTNPAPCSAAAAGHVVIAVGATSVTVNTSVFSGAGEVFIQGDSSLGGSGNLTGVTCNTTPGQASGPFRITAAVPGTSFTITTDGTTPATNPVCLSYAMFN